MLFPAFRELEFLALCLSLITTFTGGICIAERRGMSRSFEVTVKADQGSDGRSSKNFYRTKNPKTQDLIQAAIHWPSDLEGILPILRCQISYLQKGKGLAMYFLGPFCYKRYLGMIRQASQGSLQLSSPQPGRSSVRKKRTGQSGCGWSWALSPA